MQTTRAWLPAILLTGLLTTGCIVEEVEHSIYLEADGAVTWLVFQRDIRSIAESREERQQQEGERLRQLRLGEQAVARAFRDLGATAVKTRLLRERRPYAAMTRGRFESPEALLRPLFDQLGLPAEVTTTRQGGEITLAVTLQAAEASTLDEEPEALYELLSRADELRLVLAEGQFTDCRGFHVEDEDTAARFDRAFLEAWQEEAGPLVLSLTWTLPPEAG